MKRTLLCMTLATMLALPAAAQDFGHPRDKAFYQTHWADVVADQGDEYRLFGAQYMLFDFDRDGTAELYLWLEEGMDEYIYGKKGNRVVRLSEKARPVEDAFWLGQVFPQFLAPCEMLLDKPIDPDMETEQHIYDIVEVPRIWYKLHPKVKGTFNIKSAIEAVCSFDCNRLSDAMYALYSGQYSKEDVADQGYVVDVANGYARYEWRTERENMVEFCYWNMTGGEKLLAMHFNMTVDDEGTGMERTLFMKYDPKTRQLHPVVAPIKGFDFNEECHFGLPRKGKNIRLIGADNHELRWTGQGFEASETISKD